MRKLASIRKIKDIQPIDGADKIELATVDGWNVVVAKDVGHSVGDYVVYCEIDSFLPIKPEFEFLRKSSYRKLADGTEGFRLKTIRLRGQVSQGLILPADVLSGKIECDFTMSFSDCMEHMEGADVTEILGITKYEPPVPPQLAGVVRKGGFPSYVRKTDEERIQNMDKYFDAMKGEEYYVTEKLEGTSNTFYLNDDDFGVCTRNMNLKRDYDNTRWAIAKKLEIEDKMREMGENFALQGELIGEGIQKNHYKLKGQHFYAFNIFSIDEQEYVDKLKFETICNFLGINMVPVVDRNLILPDTMGEALSLADGKSLINPDVLREGLVWVGTGERYGKTQRVSFKTISNEYLVKHG